MPRTEAAEFNEENEAWDTNGLRLSPRVFKTEKAEAALRSMLSEKRRVTIQDFRGKTLVSMREYYRRDGKDLPTAKEMIRSLQLCPKQNKNISRPWFLKQQHLS
ncbi:RNA polymerase II transcriptional coactivator KELP [Camellia lanceoleosa]|uniref:RNA polymerase II transcriptional coactivator KELP n=1 Tax=Camellia lanceoleosa TaxID=1840588 RepID=A0ACC0GHE1_9ERIC|nr:RNA polymerase II transcriptional coactivator KELP [Camellia lanceoleosa]